MSNRRYAVLPVIAFVLKIIAALTALAGVLVVVAAGATLLKHDSPLGLLAALAIAAGPIVAGLLLYGLAELLDVAMDIEANTRQAAEDHAASRRQADALPDLADIRLRT